MKVCRLFLLITLFLLANDVFSQNSQADISYEKAEQMVAQGKYEEAISYLSAEARRNDIDDKGRILLSVRAVALSFKNSDGHEALGTIKPIYDLFVKKYGVSSYPAHLTRGVLVKAYQKRKAYDDALKYAQMSVRLASNKEALMESYVGLADVYSDSGKFSNAIKNYMRARKVFKQLSNKEKLNSDIGTLYHNLAHSYSEHGDYKKAIRYYQVAFRIKEKTKSSVGQTLFNLASCYQSVGQLDKARDYLQRASDVYLKEQGASGYSYLMTENHFGCLESDYGHYHEALNHFQKVYEGAKLINRSDVEAMGLKNIGSAYSDLGNYALADSYLKKSLAVYEQLPPGEHLASNYEILAASASDQNHFKEEVLYYDKALTVWQKLHQENTADYANVLTNKAMAYQKHNEYQKAEELYKQSFSILEKNAPKSKQMAILMTNQATLYIEQKQVAKAVPMLQNGIALFKQAVGEKHPDVAYAYNNLGYAYGQLRQNSQSVDAYRKAVEISSTVNGFSDPSTKLYRNNYLKAKIGQKLST